MMRRRPLGGTGLEVSEISFGAGPVSGLMTGDELDRQTDVVARAIALGINWFDTAAGYGAGRSESCLGAALAAVDPAGTAHVATKVRLDLARAESIPAQIRRSFAASLGRLRRPRVTLIQLHNSITARRNDEPTSVTPDDILGPGGVLESFEELRSEGLVGHLGLTGIGDPESLREVLRSGAFATIQAPVHLLNPSALVDAPRGFREPDYGGFLREAHRRKMGIFAIRVFAGGALLDAPPSAHTLKTPFFPAALYERDRRRAAALARALPDFPPAAASLRFVLSQPEAASAILGFGDVAHVDEAARIAEQGPWSPAELARLADCVDALVRDSPAGDSQAQPL
ncbi:MAG: aldo/keto reductase [Planctomyces sp.]|nr:aldo/keto reductase [Planctomyces sp.]